MKLVISTNIPSHHQIPLGQALANKLPGQFSLICWEPRSDTHQKLGYKDDYEYAWLIKAWASNTEKQRAVNLLYSADTVIWGSGPVIEMNKRIINGKLTFRYTERIFKRGKWRLIDPRVFYNLLNMYKFGNRNNFHLLSVGPYCAADFKFLGLFKDRMWRWGYFPAVSSIPKVINQYSPPVILWAGYMIAWKRVDLLLKAAAWVRDRWPEPFSVRLIGYGPEEETLLSLSKQLGLEDICKFEGPKSPEDVGTAMRESDIYVFPSDQNEGWGVVTNEAMTNGCCVIGSYSAGSVPWLINNGVNGYSFRGRSESNLGQILINCLKRPQKRMEVGIEARKTINKLWSPEVASCRLLDLEKALREGRTTPFNDYGPCSAA